MSRSEKAVSSEANDELARIRMNLSALQAAKLLWDRHLSEFERNKFGRSITHALARHGGVITIWSQLKGVSPNRATVEVGELLNLLTPGTAEWLLDELGETQRDPEDAKQTAIGRGDLVLIRNPPMVYWKKVWIDVDWEKNGASWEFFLIACEHAKRNTPIDCCSFGQRARPNIVTQRKSRLSKIDEFPHELVDAFEIVGTGTQRLNIPADQIYFFDVD